MAPKQKHASWAKIRNYALQLAYQIMELETTENITLELILLFIDIHINTFSVCLIPYPPATQEQDLLIWVNPPQYTVKVSPKSFIFETDNNFLQCVSISVIMSWSALAKNHFTYNMALWEGVTSKFEIFSQPLQLLYSSFKSVGSVINNLQSSFSVQMDVHVSKNKEVKTKCSEAI